MARVRTHTNPLNINHRFSSNALDDLQTDSALDVEIGFGRGVFLRQWAKTDLNRNIIGIEVRKPIVKILEERLLEEKIENALIYHGNGQYFLEDSVKDNSIDRLFIFHPDPWFKTRHHKRRVVKKEFLNIVHKKLKENGFLCISTDVDSLWNEMQKDVLANNFKKVPDKKFWENHYNTHWQTFSEQNKRCLFQESFQKIVN